MDTPERIVGRAAADQYEAWQRETIRRHGWALQAVLGDEEGPPFVYTVGLSGFEHPELIVFAATQHTAATVLNGLGEFVRAGRRLVAGESIELPESGPITLLEFPESAQWLRAAQALYRLPEHPPVPALLVLLEESQWFWPEGSGE